METENAQAVAEEAPEKEIDLTPTREILDSLCLKGEAAVGKPPGGSERRAGDYFCCPRRGASAGGCAVACACTSGTVQNSPARPPRRGGARGGREMSNAEPPLIAP